MRVSVRARAARPAAAARPHDHLRHPRPGGGQHDLRPHRRDGSRHHPAGRHAHGALRAARPTSSSRAFWARPTSSTARSRTASSRSRAARDWPLPSGVQVPAGAKLVFRPQHATLSPPAPCAARSSHREFLGATVRYGVRDGRQRDPGRCAVPVGQRPPRRGRHGRHRPAARARALSCRPERWLAKQASSPPPPNAPPGKGAGRAADRSRLRGHQPRGLARRAVAHRDLRREATRPRHRRRRRWRPAGTGRAARHGLGRREPALVPAVRGRPLLGPSLARCRRACRPACCRCGSMPAWPSAPARTPRRAAAWKLLATLDRAETANAVDVGCGSGILAIAMAKLWQRPVIGGDNDAEAVEVAQRKRRAERRRRPLPLRPRHRPAATTSCRHACPMTSSSPTSWPVR